MATNLRQIEEVFHQAITVEPEARAGYLDQACSDDDDLRHEVDSLIAAYESGNGILDENVVTLAMKVLGSGPSDSMAGKEVGPYKILSLLGQGGMGAVYLAENRRVNKKVALKFLSDDFITDNWAKRQLIKEAQAVAMLDHPNICAVYDFEEIDEYSFIVMQYIEGQTLADLIRKKSLEPSQFVPLAQQIAHALDDAHAHGIIHRDIKPKNIMVTPSEQVKVLDFGLAKTIQKNLEDATESISQLSRQGLLVGTIAYMSPEQLRGEKLDYRSDIFSLGTLLYEMVSGKNPFAHKADSKASKSNAEVISAIMADNPQPLRQVAINCPKDLDQVVNKCLSKDPGGRYQSAAELLIDLDNIQKGLALPPHVRPYLNIRFAALTALLLLVCAVALFIYSGWGSARHTLAVTPIVCDEVTIPQQCMGTALTEGLVKTLSRRSGLRVKLSEVAPAFFGPQAASPQKIAKDLNADMVMFGRISRGEKGEILTIRVEKNDGTRLWERPYPLNPDKVSNLQKRVSLETAFNLQLPMNDDDKDLFALLAADENRSADAYRLYLQGRKDWTLRDGENLKNAIDNFRRATELDPSYAEAYSGLADCYVLINTVAHGPLRDPDAMTKAEWAAKEALKFGDHLAEAHNSYAAVLMKGRWDWENAEKEFKRAIAINPDYSAAHWGYSNLLATTSRFEESLAESKLARDLEPFSPPAIMSYCRAQYFARQFTQANACLEKLLIDQPNYTGGKYMHGIVLIELGRMQEAIQIFEQIYAKDKAYGGAMLGFSYGIANRRADAERVLNEMQEFKKQRDFPVQELGIIYLGLNDLEHAFALLRKSVEDKFPPAQSIFIAPMFDRLRADHRFAELARQVRLPARPAASVAALNSSAR